MNEARLQEKLETFLEQLVTADQFSGAVLLAKHNTPIFRRAYGLAHKAYNVPNQANTKFNLGSMNKMFTAVAIAQLAEQGKLAFTDTIRKYLPDYSNAIADRVTIHHLLTHTSGMGSYWTAKFDATWHSLRTVNDFIPLFVDDPLTFEPGEKWQYSNAGFIVLGAIIERVSEQNYFDYVKEHIYEPAGMPNTDAYELDHTTPNLALGYTKLGLEHPAPGEWLNNLLLHVVKGGPAGGGFSTVDDLLNFSIALRSYSLLSKTYTNIVLTGKVDRAHPEMGRSRYGYGFGDDTVNGKRIVGHSGGAPGISSHLDIYLDSGYTVALLSNYDPPASKEVASWLRQKLTQA